jgi:hypothetical protein
MNFNYLLSKKARHKRLMKVISAIATLQSQRKVFFNMQRRCVFISPELWEGRKKKDLNTWCRNFFVYFRIKQPKFKDKEAIYFKHIDSGQLMGTYTKDKGLILENPLKKV